MIDINEYLPPETRQWCRDKLRELGFPIDSATMQLAASTGKRIHCQAYRRLREAIRTYILSGGLSKLEESTKPVGAWDWQPSAASTTTDGLGTKLVASPGNLMKGDNSLDQIKELGIVGEGPED